MAGYTRQSSFADGDTITAALFNDEYNQLVNAFNNATGHKHDGTAAEGPVIGLIGDAGETSPNNKVLIDSTNNYIEFYIEVSSAPVQQLYIADGAIVPVTDNDIDLGTSSLEFKNLYLDGTAKIDTLTVDEAATVGTTLGVTGATTLSSTLGVTGATTLSSTLAVTGATTLSSTLAVTGTSTLTGNVTTTNDLSVGGNLTVTGNATISGNLTFGDADTDTITIGADVASNITPDVDDTYDLGSSTKEWRNLYIDGTANIDSLVADTADINAGTIDNTAIGGTTASSGAFTTLTASGATTLNGNVTLGDAATDNVVFNADVNSSIIPNTDDLYDLGSVSQEWRNLYIDGIANIDSLVADTADINGGTIDGVTIGGTTAGAVTFTDLSDGTITIAGFVDEDTMVSNSATLLPTQQSVKAYVDSQVTAQDLDFQGDTGGALSIDLDSETLTIAGGTGIDTTGATNTLTVSIDSTVATLTGTQTLTNKTLTTPVISSISNTGTLTLPTSTDTLVGRATTDTLTNKTLTSPVINTSVSGTAFLDDDTFATASATTFASSESIKAYVDAQVATANELSELTDVNITTPADGAMLFYDTATSKWIDNVVSGDIVIADTGVATIQPNSVALGTDTTGDYVGTITAGTGLTSTGATSGEGIAHSLSVDASQTQITAVGTLTTGTWNATSIADAYIDDNLTISGGTVDNSVIGGSTPAAGTFTTLTANTSITGTLATAAQTNITSVGTLSSLTVSGDLTVDTSTLVVDSTNNRVGILDATPAVSLDIGTATDAIHVPVGTTAERPTAAAGMFRYNTTLSQFEGYTTEWGAIGGGGTNTFTRDSFSGDGSTTAFTLSQAIDDENDLIVFIEGVFQNQGAYSVSGTTLTFDTAPANGNTIIVYSVKVAVSGTNLNQDSFSGDGSTVAFTLSINPVNENNTQVFIDGVYQQKDAYSTSGTTLTFTAAPPNGTTIEVMTFTQTEINVPVDGTITPAKIASGDFYFDTNTLYIDATNNMVGIGTSSPSSFGTGANNLVVGSGSGDEGISIYSGSANTSRIYFADGTSAGAQYDGFIVYNHSSQLMSFGTGATGSQHLNIDSSGNVGIGTTSPSTYGLFTVSGSGITNHINSTSGAGGINFYETGSGRFSLRTLNGSAGLAFYDTFNTAERMRITSGGNVLINTTTDLGGSLNVISNKGSGAIIKTRNGDGNDHIHLIGDSNIKYGALGLSTSVGSADAVLEANLNLRFNTGGSNERMRIHSNGAISTGTTNSNSVSVGGINVGGTSILNSAVGILSVRSLDSGETAAETLASFVSYRNDTSTSNVFVRFAIDQYNSGSGQINANGASQAAFGSYSDSRLKENIIELPNQLNNIKSLRPVEFDYIESEGGGHQIGFIAQEVEEIYPDLVGEREDGMKTLTGLGKFEARLIKAIQEQQVLIEQLQAEVALLKGE
jgi:hypothetical protein